MSNDRRRGREKKGKRRLKIGSHDTKQVFVLLMDTWAQCVSTYCYGNLPSQQDTATWWVWHLAYSETNRFLSQDHAAWLSWDNTSFTSGRSLASLSQQHSRIPHNLLVKPRPSAPSGFCGRSPPMILIITLAGFVVSQKGMSP